MSRRHCVANVSSDVDTVLAHWPHVTGGTPSAVLTTVLVARAALATCARPTEDGWVGKRLTFGAVDGPAVGVTHRDKRCVMISIDPETAQSHPEVLKTALRLNECNAGVYATAAQTGELRVGQSVWLAED